MLKPIVSFFLGAGVGALLRWWLGGQLNSLLPAIPLGTLSANLIGGYIIGVAIAFFAAFSAIAPEWRPVFLTGLLCWVTTIFAFSARIPQLLPQTVVQLV